MEKTEDIQTSKMLVQKIDLVLLLIHICLLFFFAAMHVWLMAGVNVCSVAVYAVMIRVSQKNTYVFLLVTFYEIFIHMILAVVCVGWNFGFQWYCFSLILVIFYCDYIGKSEHGKTSHPISVSIMVISSFVILRAITWQCGSIYPAGNAFIAMLGNLMNAFFDFIFLIFYMANYERLTIQTEHVASKDQLTGLNNRHKMRDIMQVVMKQQGNQENLAFSILDIDNFKKINDTYGHNVGDDVLRAVAERIERLQYKQMYVCRWGGEEFLVMAVGENCYEDIKEIIASLVQEIHDMVVFSDGKQIAVTITAGAARGQAHEKVDHIISRADKYLYEGKLSGKNKLVAGDA